MSRLKIYGLIFLFLIEITAFSFTSVTAEAAKKRKPLPPMETMIDIALDNALKEIAYNLASEISPKKVK